MFCSHYAFPEMFEACYSLRHRQDGKAILYKSLVLILVILLKTEVDERPFGGGPGMVMMAEPLAKAIAHAKQLVSQAGHVHVPVVYMSPQGKTLNEQAVQQFVDYDGLIVLCGRYEGVDERLIQHYVDQEWSIGDYVLSGGELPAMVLLDSIIRRLPNVMSDEQSAVQDSLLMVFRLSTYTKPDHFEGLDVPEVLKSGHHGNIEKWRFCSDINEL